jgi:hypothetical protein
MVDLFKYSDFEFGGELVDENPKCYFVEDGINQVPIPKSQVRKMRRADGGGDNWIFTIPYWLAKEKGIV